MQGKWSEADNRTFSLKTQKQPKIGPIIILPGYPLGGAHDMAIATQFYTGLMQKSHQMGLVKSGILGGLGWEFMALT